LVDLELTDRLSFDVDRNILFLNFEGLHVRSSHDVSAIRDAVTQKSRMIGKRVAVVVNYDSFRPSDDVASEYAEMVRDMEDAHYTQVSRYTTSAFMRVKLGRELTRTVRPHIFESKAEAQAFHVRDGVGGSHSGDESPNKRVCQKQEMSIDHQERTDQEQSIYAGKGFGKLHFSSSVALSTNLAPVSPGAITHTAHLLHISSSIALSTNLAPVSPGAIAHTAYRHSHPLHFATIRHFPDSRGFWPFGPRRTIVFASAI
jgi:hypothetical protein